MGGEELRLAEPGTEWEGEVRAMEEEFGGDGDTGFLHDVLPGPGGFAAMVERLAREARGDDLPEGYVPQRTYWLVRADGRMLGLSRLRTRLTPALLDSGGNIGYAVRPSERRKGYGARLLALTMERAREIGLRRVRVTCDPANTASARIIEKNGGTLASQSWSERMNRITSRYWIECCPPEQRFDLRDTAFVCVDIQTRGPRLWTWENRHPDYVKSNFTPDELNAAERHFHGILLPNALKTAEFARETGLPRVFVHWSDGRIHESFDLMPGDHVVPKTEMDAFISSDLAGVLTALRRRTLLMIGGHTQGCLGRTATSALKAGYRCVCVRDATYDCSILRWPKGIAAVAYDAVVDTADLTSIDRSPFQPVFSDW